MTSTLYKIQPGSGLISMPQTICFFFSLSVLLKLKHKEIQQVISTSVAALISKRLEIQQGAGLQATKNLGQKADAQINACCPHLQT